MDKNLIYTETDLVNKRENLIHKGKCNKWSEKLIQQWKLSSQSELSSN